MCQILLWVKNPKGPFGKQIQSAPGFQMTKIFRYQERLPRRGSVWAGIEGSGKVDIEGGAGHSQQKGQPVHRQNVCTHQGTSTNAPKSRCWICFFCSETCARRCFKLFLQNKITSQIKCLLKCKNIKELGD